MGNRESAIRNLQSAMLSCAGRMGGFRGALVQPKRSASILELLTPPIETATRTNGDDVHQPLTPITDGGKSYTGLARAFTG